MYKFFKRLIELFPHQTGALEFIYRGFMFFLFAVHFFQFKLNEKRNHAHFSPFRQKLMLREIFHFDKTPENKEAKKEKDENKEKSISAEDWDF